MQDRVQFRKAIHGRRRFLAVAVLPLFFLTALRLRASEPETGVDPIKQEASLVILNGKIWVPGLARVRPADGPEQPTAIAIKDDKILVVGDENAVRRVVGSKTRVIDIGGRRILPGITDSHTHIISGGLQMERLALRRVRNKSEFIKAIGIAAKGKQPGEWVLGGRWSVESWSDPAPPHRSWIDPVTGSVPVLLSRMDGHQALANTAALRLAGIDAKGPTDPPGGEIQRDPITGEPTGILKESAVGLVRDLVPRTSTAERYEALRRAMAHANSLGVTSVHDMCGLEDLDAFRLADNDDPPGGEIQRDPITGEPTGILKESAAGLVRDLVPRTSTAERYEALRRAMAHANSLGVTSVHDMCGLEDLDAFRLADNDGAMTVRVTAYLSVVDWPAFLEHVSTYAHESDMFRLAGFKGYMDGSLGSRTAYMKEPYLDSTSDTPYPRGQLNAMADPPEAFRRLVAIADAKGLQLAVHAIGDQANHLALDAYEAALKANGARRAYHRVEHVQHLLVSDIARFAELGVVASMQPFHKADDGRYAEKALDRARLAGSYAFRQLLDAGALLCFGSDWPVVTINPFAGIASAVNATTLDGKIWLPSHSISLDEALEAYTLSPARAIHRENRLGSIEPGKFADIVVLKDDPFSMPPTRLADVRVAMTIVAGKIVYSSGN